MKVAPPPYEGSPNSNPPAPPAVILPVSAPVPTSTNVVIVQQPSAQAHFFHRASVSMTCPKCNANIWTRIEKTCVRDAWVCCVLLCCCGCGLCSLLPFCMDSYKKFTHRCPECSHIVGEYSSK